MLFVYDKVYSRWENNWRSDNYVILGNMVQRVRRKDLIPHST